MTDADRETIDLMFEISKNEGERHGKMPTFGRSIGGNKHNEREDEVTQEEPVKKKPDNPKP